MTLGLIGRGNECVLSEFIWEFHDYSSPTEGSIISSSTTMRHQRPHSLHIGDDFMTQLVELQQANRELHEVLQHERGEVTKLKLQNEELARKLEEALREKHELESLLKPKVRLISVTPSMDAQPFRFRKANSHRSSTCCN